ncbi:alpha-L-fucosidase [Akkermansiaceae bacterium]|nr:alpha-L-fucosidase [Akkermansiaceae bacterium]
MTKSTPYRNRLSYKVLSLLVLSQLSYAEDDNLAEDPFTIELDDGRKKTHEAWKGKSPEELRQWAKKSLHHKLTAKKIINESDHPEWDWFRKSGLGLFIHWGLPSANLDTGDAWAVMWSEKKQELGRYMEPATKMFSVADTWNPEKYDPEKWMEAASKAGFGYSVLTTRHHDGYALWPSDHGTWDTGEYMGGRDLIKPYVEACRNNDIRVGFYYSGPNWHYAHEHKEFEFPRTDKYTVNHKHEHVDKIPDLTKEMKAAEAAESKGQVRELMSNYGPVDVVWWDGNVAMEEEELQAIQPNVFVARGNIATPEGLHMGTDENVKVTNEAGWWWEQCVKSENSFTPNWHYGIECETNHWDTNTILSELVRARSLGGNLLVNIPPRGNGEMMEWFYEACDEMSVWMKHSREAVYDVDLDAPLPTLDQTKNYTTKRGNIYYSLPNEKNTIIINGVKSPESVVLLRTGESLEFEYVKTSMKVVVPPSMMTALPDMVKITFPK